MLLQKVTTLVKLIRQVHCFFAGIAAAVPAQSQFIVPAPSPQYMQGSGSDQTTG
jgi:hypothetical protein